MAGSQGDTIDKPTRAVAEPARLAPPEVHPVSSPVSWPPAPVPYGVMVVGAGLVGAVMARSLAAEVGCKVLVVDESDEFGDRDSDPAALERLLDHPNIDVLLGIDWAEARACYAHDHLVFTGASGDQMVLPWPKQAFAEFPQAINVAAPAGASLDEVARIVAPALAQLRGIFAEDAADPAPDGRDIASAA
ncbi:MAG: NAD-binding protein [Rhizorhabdus sp.]